MRRIILILLAISCLGMTGCATSRGLLDISIPAATSSAMLDVKEVYINSITDKRVFEVSPTIPSIPSLDPSKEDNSAIRLRAVGRKRNTYGKALGDLLLREGETVERLIAASISKAFAESGYKILKDRSQVTPNTYIVDCTIDKFWTWMNPGFWQITISTEIETTLIIAPSENDSAKKISILSQYPTQAGFESNYIKCLENALQAYIDELKRHLQ